MDAKEKAFQYAYKRYIGEWPRVDDTYRSIKESSYTSKEFFNELSDNVATYPLSVVGKRALLELELDDTLTDKERAIEVACLDSFASFSPALCKYPFYLESMLIVCLEEIAEFLLAEGREHPRMLCSMRTLTCWDSLVPRRYRESLAKKVFRLRGVERDLFIDGTPLSIEELKIVCR